MTGTETTGQETDSVDSVSPQAAINSTFTRIRGESGESESVTRRASPTLRFRFAAVLVLILAVAVRLVSAPGVFRGGEVVFAANDPWHYRDRVLHLRETADGLGLEAVGAETGEPLFYWLGYLWTRTLDVVGVGPDAALALLPIVLAMASVAVVGQLALSVTGDKRIGLLAMVLLVVHPGHVRYSMVGIVDHHALDYLLLALVLLLTVRVVTADSLMTADDWIGPAALLATAIAASVLAWNGAPLLILPPLVLVAAVMGRRGAGGVMMRLSLALFWGSVLAAGPHLFWGWQEPAAVVAPAVAGLGTAAIGGGVLLTTRPDWTVTDAATVAAVPAAATGLVLAAYPSLATRTQERVVGDLLGRPGIVEAASVFHPRVLTALTPLWFVGPLLVALPAIGWLLWARRGDRAWLVIGVATAVYGGLVVIQLRFAGPLGIPLAVAAAATLVAAGSEMADIEPPGADSLRWSGSVAVLVFLAFVVAACAVVSIGAGSTLVVDDNRYAAAQALDERADGEPVILTQWSDSRLYNGVVSDRSDSYRLSLQHFGPVVTGREAVPEHVDFVVVDERRIPDAFDSDWHDGVATRVWAQKEISIYEVTA
jgi:hypothetical protein